MVECHLAKVKVAGPNPVSRSIEKPTRLSGGFFYGAGDGSAHACVSKQGAQVLRVAQNLAAKEEDKYTESKI